MSMVESQFRFNEKPVLVVMGVSGCGKSTVAAALAHAIELPYIDGDDYHPPENVEKMANAIPLSDEDRWPWLDHLGLAIRRHSESHGGVIATCSALKKAYRTHLLSSAKTPLYFILLHGGRDTLLARMQARENHYMPPSLLDSQLATLELPQEEEPVWQLSIDLSVDQQVQAVLSHLKALTST